LFPHLGGFGLFHHGIHTLKVPHPRDAAGLQLRRKNPPQVGKNGGPTTSYNYIYILIYIYNIIYIYITMGLEWIRQMIGNRMVSDISDQNGGV
jgi:hypothetical protein